MEMPSHPTQIKWAAKVDHVREVTIRGTAELAFWRERLAAHGLFPAAQDGRAQILLTGAAMRFAGVSFAELSVSVMVEPLVASPGEAAFLVGASNSSRLFAFCERTFFSTPYVYGSPRLAASVPARVSLVVGGETVFDAKMGDGSDAVGRPRRPTFEGDGGWSGPVYLPSHGPRERGMAKMFFARVQGTTQIYGAQLADSLVLRPPPGESALRPLADSGFALARWEIRPDATHAKSKTYAAPGQAPATALGRPE